MTEGTEELLPLAEPEVVVAPKKTTRKKAVKEPSASASTDGVRNWQDVVPQIRELKDAGATVPEIAEKLQLSYVLVNQVMVQSYKMSVDTIGVFERQEKLRLGIEA
jgi:hypothetical protein